MKQGYPEIDVNGKSWLAGDFVRPHDLPAKTKFDFSKLKIASRLLIGLACLGAGVWCMATYVVGVDSVNIPAVVGGGLLLVFGAWFTVVSVNHLFFRKPVLTIDLEGLAFLKHGPVSWANVVAVGVRVSQTHDSSPALFLKVASSKSRQPFEVELTQTRTEPEALFRILKSYVAAYRDANGLPT